MKAQVTREVLDHVSICVSDFEKARPIYDAIFAALEIPKVVATAEKLGYGVRCEAGQPSGSYISVLWEPQQTPSARNHWCFKAERKSHVDRAHREGLAAGGTCEGPPGYRTHYHESYYCAFLLDGNGNKLEFVCHAEVVAP